MKTKINRRASRAAYSLVEVAVASTILMVGVGAACVLSLTMIKQEESNVKVSRAINLMENVARLYHLGIDPDTAIALLPPDPMIVTNGFTWREPNADSPHFDTIVSMPQIGNPDCVLFSMNFYTASDGNTWLPGTWGGRPDGAVAGQEDFRTIGPLRVYRSSFRP
jgi:hypothetical protein